MFIVGQDMGGGASLWACGADPSIAGLVIADVHASFSQAVGSRVGKASAIKKLAKDVYVWGHKDYFRTNDNQFSAVHVASLLSANQSLMIITRDKNEGLKMSTIEILQGTNAKAQKIVVDKVQSCLLNDKTVVAPAILGFITGEGSDKQTVVSNDVSQTE